MTTGYPACNVLSARCTWCLKGGPEEDRLKSLLCPFFRKNKSDYKNEAKRRKTEENFRLPRTIPYHIPIHPTTVSTMKQGIVVSDRSFFFIFILAQPSKKCKVRRFIFVSRGNAAAVAASSSLDRRIVNDFQESWARHYWKPGWIIYLWENSCNKSFTVSSWNYYKPH